MLRLALDLLVARQLLNSRLFDEQAFYRAFRKDLARARRRVVIESPYMTTKRVAHLLPSLESLVKRGVGVRVNTRDPAFHSEFMCDQAREAICKLEAVGVGVRVYGDPRHWKTAIIDDRVLWEGSLNILSHGRSREMMRRLQSARLCRSTIRFIGE